jgi:hypothetical protein
VSPPANDNRMDDEAGGVRRRDDGNVEIRLGHGIAPIALPPEYAIKMACLLLVAAGFSIEISIDHVITASPIKAVQANGGGHEA